jgi:gliding motility-associated protein GldC
MSKISEIKFTVTLDDKKVPERIEWEATDSGFKGKKECSSMLISLWDKEEKGTLGIDLWTKEMVVDDMNIHFHQMFNKLADTYERSTKNKEAADMIKNFSSDFAEKTEIIKKVKKQ